ncbi:presenilin associated rhomboid [Echinococcus multilocularis]|uniref:rhomboid protease n=1 Tax=Echinococcus multilocularis TaxID=6211 RepID=A0A068Y4K7_ECHMU|nr:presenilin associated rhomboid [Echinococcus multilocularis]
MSRRIIFFSSCYVELGIFRQFSLGRSGFSRLRDTRGPISLHDKPVYQHPKRSPQPKSSSFNRSTVFLGNNARTFKQTFLQCGLFTFVSINTIFVGSMIWNYENWRAQISKHGKGGFQQTLRGFFTAIVGRPPQSSDIFWAIAFTNFIIFICNNNRRYGPTFLRYFANSPYGPWPATSMLLSIFSHQMFFHMFLNMYVLNNFTQPLVRFLGMEQYLAVFLSGGIFASFLSALVKAARGSRIPSIGASGAVCAVLGAFCMLEPHAMLCLPLVVNIVPHAFSAGSACWAIVAFEACGATFLARRSPIDHAAHLGGLLFGMYYGLEGKKVVLNHRDAVIKVWRSLKGESGKASK